MTLEPQELNRHTELAVEIAKIAGQRILELFLPEIAVSQKPDDTPLTAADLAAHRVIVSRLKALEPALPVITEESDAASLSERATWDTYWLVDPLDGTREFIKKNGEFSVNIALIHRGQPVLGVIHAPVLEITYWACRGSGAWKQAGDDQPRKINVRTAPAQGITVALGWSARFSHRMERFLDRLGTHQELRMGGALKSCLVAEGRADLYDCLGPTGEWDTGAAQCIVEEAGGQITDTQMRALRYNSRDSLLNPDFFAFGKSNRQWSDYLG